MKIRKIKKEDLLDCAEILKSVYSISPYNENFIDNNEFKYINSKYIINKKNSFIVLDKNKIIWFCFCSLSYWANWPQWIIEEIVVLNEYQWLWMWKKLYNHCEKYFKKLWVKSLMLWCQNNALAYNFHKKNWFINSTEHSIMFKDL